VAELITSLTVMFAAATVALLASIKFEQPAIPLYILSGLAISSFVSQNQILNLSQIGISFLVFIYGVRFSTDRLKSVAYEGFAASATSLILTGGLALAIGFLLKMTFFESMVFASAAALSSSLVGLELVSDDLRKELVHGRIIESIQLIQDLAAVLIILLMFSQEPISAVLKGFGLLAAAFVFKESLPYLAEGFKDSTEAIMVFSLAVLAISVTASQFMGISIVIGAFAGGISLSKYPYNIEVIDTVGTLKDFFTAVFFVSIGSLAATLNPAVASLSILIALLTLIVKPAITYVTLRFIDWDSRVSFLSSLGLDQVSEFSAIIAIQAFIIGRIQEPLLQSVVLATAFTMSLSSYTDKHDQSMYNKFSEFFGLEDDIESNVDNPEDHVILVGYDTQGQKILNELTDEREVVVIEYDPEKVEILKKEDANYVFGDVMYKKSWEEADYKQAEMIISTVPVDHVSRKILSLDSKKNKILRSSKVDQAEKLLDQGAMFVSVPKILASQRVVEHIVRILNNENYDHELRRKNLLELRKQQE
jgi:CPA2 family monovalent cation:H+ antiporter-2